MTQRTNRIIFNILAKDIEETAAFYETLCGLKRIYTSDWYIVLSPDGGLGDGALNYELGIIDEVHRVVPTASRGMFAGGYLTLVVDDVEQAFLEARRMGADVVQEPTPLDYGQTQMILRDPNGVVVDISTPTEH
ncbi:VOC family protein [Pelagibacterium xiamenense]|uniref:VOC family protein n=1 Tax=Pelagibacterium xiamenense TaxID=2901140 RepID=UPI001E5D4817|nr:VOC family protein [Pelagibacterium xiamenense]MCD7061148.1 VOC family protein [Pelagibacterium xiamenense]